MLKLIYGAKGSGKTKRIIDAANASLEESDGYVVFITDTNRYMSDIKYQIRAVNLADYSVCTEEQFIGFVKGVIAGNHDITHFFIDGIHRFLKKDVSELEWVYGELSRLAVASEIKFTITVSKDFDGLPEFLKKFVD
ncbi:MAG TPA: ATP-binding protein [Eubacteriales bacterium]|jgi:thymidine kinase|nr:ATP-binding protein [Clostridia bacterium]HRR89216.1 ATP-binding protein [Eubacteriales bacterium]HRU84711.1 ATP-binding protein [Eubacteriales bacterium]